MDPDERLGATVRERRLGLGLSLDQLAHKTQISVAQLSLVERGKRRPSRGLSIRISRALDLPHLVSNLPDSVALPAPNLNIAELLQRSVQRSRAFSEESRSEVLYRRLHHAIVHGELRPNDRLVEGDLARALNVSRTPIRECLQRLAADGLVEHRARNWAVHEHTALEITHIYEVRAALEGYAACQASARATPEQRSMILEQANETRLAPTEPHHEFVLRNESFHDAIVAAAGNPRLAETILQSRQYYFNHQLVTLYTPQDTDSARFEHQAIAKAIANGDGALAEQLSRQHVAAALQIVLRAAPRDREPLTPLPPLPVANSKADLTPSVVES